MAHKRKLETSSATASAANDGKKHKPAATRTGKVNKGTQGDVHGSSREPVRSGLLVVDKKQSPLVATDVADLLTQLTDVYKAAPDRLHAWGPLLEQLEALTYNRMMTLGDRPVAMKRTFSTLAEGLATCNRFERVEGLLRHVFSCHKVAHAKTHPEPHNKGRLVLVQETARWLSLAPLQAAGLSDTLLGCLKTVYTAAPPSVWAPLVDTLDNVTQQAWSRTGNGPHVTRALFSNWFMALTTTQRSARLLDKLTSFLLTTPRDVDLLNAGLAQVVVPIAGTCGRLQQGFEVAESLSHCLVTVHNSKPANNTTWLLFLDALEGVAHRRLTSSLTGPRGQALMQSATHKFVAGCVAVNRYSRLGGFLSKAIACMPQALTSSYPALSSTCTQIRECLADANIKDTSLLSRSSALLDCFKVVHTAAPASDVLWLSLYNGLHTLAGKSKVEVKQNPGQTLDIHLHLLTASVLCGRVKEGNAALVKLFDLVYTELDATVFGTYQLCQRATDAVKELSEWPAAAQLQAKTVALFHQTYHALAVQDLPRQMAAQAAVIPKHSRQKTPKPPNQDKASVLAVTKARKLGTCYRCALTGMMASFRAMLSGQCSKPDADAADTCAVALSFGWSLEKCAQLGFLKTHDDKTDEEVQTLRVEALQVYGIAAEAAEEVARTTGKPCDGTVYCRSAMCILNWSDHSPSVRLFKAAPSIKAAVSGYTSQLPVPYNGVRTATAVAQSLREFGREDSAREMEELSDKIHWLQRMSSWSATPSVHALALQDRAPNPVQPRSVQQRPAAQGSHRAPAAPSRLSRVTLGDCITQSDFARSSPMEVSSHTVGSLCAEICELGDVAGSQDLSESEMSEVTQIPDTLMDLHECARPASRKGSQDSTSTRGAINTRSRARISGHSSLGNCDETAQQGEVTSPWVNAT